LVEDIDVLAGSRNHHEVGDRPPAAATARRAVFQELATSRRASARVSVIRIRS